MRTNKINKKFQEINLYRYRNSRAFSLKEKS